MKVFLKNKFSFLLLVFCLTINISYSQSLNLDTLYKCSDYFITITNKDSIPLKCTSIIRLNKLSLNKHYKLLVSNGRAIYSYSDTIIRCVKMPDDYEEVFCLSVYVDEVKVNEIFLKLFIIPKPLIQVNSVYNKSRRRIKLKIRVLNSDSLIINKYTLDCNYNSDESFVKIMRNNECIYNKRIKIKNDNEIKIKKNIKKDDLIFIEVLKLYRINTWHDKILEYELYKSEPLLLE
jgi:hypothetical protein